MATQALERELDPVAATPADLTALVGIEEFLKRARESDQAKRCLKLVGPDGTAVELPETVLRLLRRMIPHLMRGDALSLVPVHAELTTQQAADILNVSRPFLIGLLEQGEIPYTKTGKHRRIKFRDLMRYKEIRDANRHEALDRLTRLSQEFGLDAYQD